MPDVLPLFPLGVVLFPGAALPLHVFEPRYRSLVADLLAGPEPHEFGVVAIREGHEVGTDAVKALHDVGCVAEIRQLQRAPDGRYAMVTGGTRRFRLLDLDRTRPYLQAEVEMLDEPAGDRSRLELLSTRAGELFTTYVTATGRADVAAQLPGDPTARSYAIAAGMAIELADRQSLLAAADTVSRLGTVVDLLTRELALMQNLRTVPLPRPAPPQSLN